MISKDKLFDINEFVCKNNCNQLAEVSESFFYLTSDLVKNTKQQSIINKFIMRNGYKNICDIEKSIYNMFQEVINCCEVVEVTE